MSTLSLLWVLVVSGHVLQVSSKKSTTLKKRQQVLRSAAGNFLLHLSPVKDDEAQQEEFSSGTRPVLFKSNKNNDYDSQNGHLVKGHDLNKSKKIRLFSAEKHQTALRNGVLRNEEILIDNGDEVWPKSEEEPEMREETKEEHLGRKVNFDGSHKEQFKNNELNPRQDDFPETNIEQVLHYEDGKDSHETAAQTEITKSGLVGKESTQPTSRVGGERQDTALQNATNLKENVQKSFNNKSGFKSGLARLKAPLDMQHNTPKVDASLVNEPENSHMNNDGTLHAKQNVTLQYAFPPPEELGFLSKTTTKMRFRDNSLDNANHGNMPDELNTAEHKNGSQNYDHISVPALESAEQHYKQRQRESDQDVHPENLLAQGFQQAEENTRPHVRNQTMKIVYFVKMATGIPLYHDKPIPDVKQAQQRTSNKTLMSVAVQQEPKGINAQDFSESHKELEGTRRQDEEALQKPPIPNHFHALTQDLQRKEHQDVYHPPMSANVSETNKGIHDKNERQGEQVTRNDSGIPNFDHVSMQGLLKQKHRNNFLQLPLSTDFSKTNKYMQGRKNENQDQQISHNSSIPNSDHFSTQGLLEQEKENEHHQPLSADVSKTNKDMQNVNGQNDHSNTARIPNSDKVSMPGQNNITNLNTITITMPPVPNMAVQPNFNPNSYPYPNPYPNPKPNANANANNHNHNHNHNHNPNPNPDPDPNPNLYPYPYPYHNPNPNPNPNPSLLQEQGLQEPDILTDEPSVELKSNEDDEEGTVNPRQGTNSRPWDSNRFRNRYRNRPRGGNLGGGNTGGPVTAPGNTGGPAGSPAPQTASEFAEDALQAHNKYRQVHNADPMILDRDLSNQAQGYAQRIASMQSLTHSSDQERGDDVGENLAYACKTNGVPLTGSETTKMWYDEVCEYNFNRGGFNMNSGHFTQVVWKDSLDLGMGMAETSENGMKCIYAVGRYRQAGNFGGQYSDKVTRGNFDQSYCKNVRK